MQYRLSTIFLVFFVTAASLAVFNAWGIWVAADFCLAALAFNKMKSMGDGLAIAILIVILGNNMYLAE